MDKGPSNHQSAEIFKDAASPPTSNCASYAMSSPEDEAPLPPPAENQESIDLEQFSDVTYEPSPPCKVLDLCPIPSFTKLFSILYALYKKQEFSKRAFHLTTACLKENPSNPTVWVYRRKLVDHLSSQYPLQQQMWQTELGFAASMLKMSKKNYQAWEYRRHCVKRTQTYIVEFDFIDVTLSDDAKNYHAWGHRAWLVRQLKHLERLDSGTIHQQVRNTEWYIRSDVRNNSAWNFRSFVLTFLSPIDSLNSSDKQVLVSPQSEVQFAKDMAALAPRNESPWNYLIHLYRRYQVDLSNPLQYASRCLSIDAGCIAARRFLVLVGPRQTDEDLRRLQEHCTLLANGIDPVRKKYWLFKREELELLRGSC